MNNIRKCGHCGAEMEAGDLFCPVCGTAAQPENMVRCGKCGQMNEAGNRFCMACGEPLGAFNEALSFEDDYSAGGAPAADPYDALDDDLTDDDLFGVGEPEIVPEPEKPRQEEKAEEPKPEKVKNEKVKTEKPKKEKAPKEKAPKEKKKKSGLRVVLIIVLVLVIAAAAASYLLPEMTIGNLRIGRPSGEAGSTPEPTAMPTNGPDTAPIVTTPPAIAEDQGEAAAVIGPAVPAQNPPVGSFVQAMTKLDLMEGPGEEFASVGIISAGDVADYLGEMMIAADGEGWYLVSHNGAEGWLSARYMQLMN